MYACIRRRFLSKACRLYANNLRMFHQRSLELFWRFSNLSTAVVILEGLACAEIPQCSGATPHQWFSLLAFKTLLSLSLSFFLSLSPLSAIWSLLQFFTPSLSLSRLLSVSLWSWHLQGPRSHWCYTSIAELLKSSLVFMHKPKISTFYCPLRWLNRLQTDKCVLVSLWDKQFLRIFLFECFCVVFS